MSNLEKLIIGNKPVMCEKCGGKMFYIHSGKYQCHDCVRVLAGGIRTAFSLDMGERPKNADDGHDMNGKMHYFKGFRH